MTIPLIELTDSSNDWGTFSYGRHLCRIFALRFNLGVLKGLKTPHHFYVGSLASEKALKQIDAYTIKDKYI